MRCASLFFVLLLLCKGLLANPAAPGLSVYYGAASQLGIGAISKAEAEISFGKLLAIGTPAEIQANPEVRRAYLGESDEEAVAGKEAE